MDTLGAPTSRSGAGFSVRDFGAVGDGKADDTDAFIAALAAASASHRSTFLGVSVSDVFVPAGEYLLTRTLQLNSSYTPGLHGEGTAIVNMVNRSADIIYGAAVWKWRISGLFFVGGRNHLHLGTKNLDTASIIVEHCGFSNASSAAVRMIGPQAKGSAEWPDGYEGSASTQFTVRSCQFFHCEQVVVNWCDTMSVLDCWVTGCYMPTCGANKALFENHDTLILERLLGVPHPVPGSLQRWIDNEYGTVVAKSCRFGGEGGGFTVLLNNASFLRTAASPKGEPPWVPGPYIPPPGHGPLPNGTGWWPDPQAAMAIFEDCQFDSFGSKVRQASIWLRQLPALLVVRRSMGLAYDPRWGPSANQTFLQVDPRLDLDGPQLSLAAGRMRIEIGGANDWMPAGHYSTLPQQLWPYATSPQRGYDGDQPLTGPPTKGVWQVNQEVLAAFNSTPGGPRGWRCTRAGKPGEWEAF
jgi:hypothetical protein